jgi:hypothetical protein
MADRYSLETRFGATNIFKWADVDNTKDEALVAARIQRALEWAEADLISMLNNTPPAEAQIVLDDIIERKAAIWLYGARGTGADDPMAEHRTFIDSWVNRYNSGRVRFTTPQAPHVINDCPDSGYYSNRERCGLPYPESPW